MWWPGPHRKKLRTSPSPTCLSCPAVGKLNNAVASIAGEWRPYTSLTFTGGTQVSALIDSGASRSLLRRDIFLSLCKSISRSPILKRTLPLFSVSKNPLHVLGEAHVSLAGGTNWPWVIVENIPYGAILGADLLQHVAADLDFHSNTITMSNVVLPLTFDDNLPPAITSLDSPLLTLLDSYQDVFHTPGEPIKPCLLSPLIIDTGTSLPVPDVPIKLPWQNKP